MTRPLNVVIIKPSKYMADGYVERFRWGFMPNSTVPHVRSMTPPVVGCAPVEVHAVDEYVHTDLQYMSLLNPPRGGRTLLVLVGVQSHQFHRALDLAVVARSRGCMAVIGGPHVMTCDTSMLHEKHVSFAQVEAELVWSEILLDAAEGALKPVYGRDQRWQQQLEAPVIIPPSDQDLSRYVIPMLGLYPARDLPRYRTAVPEERHQFALLQHHRFPTGLGGGRLRTPPSAARVGPDVGIFLHPLPDSRHRAIR